MAAVWAFLGPLLYLVGLTGTFLYVFKKRYNFQFLLPVTIITATLTVYFLTFVTHRLSIGIIVTVIAAAAFVPLLIRDNKRRDLFKTLLFTPAFFIFVALYAIIFMLHYNWVPQIFSDDLMHWAPHVWTMWARDDFYTAPGLSIVTHGDYQPILQLFQLIFVRVGGMYREGLLYVALELTSFAMLFPLLKNLTWQRKHGLLTALLAALITICLLVLPTLLDVTHLFYNALHPDYAIAFVFAYAAFLAVRGSRRFTWRGALLLSFTITFLCLTKQSSVLFGGVAALLYTAGLWLNHRPGIRALMRQAVSYGKRWRIHWRQILLAACLVVLPVAGLKLWSYQTRDFQAPYCCVAKFHISPGDALKVPGVLTGRSGDESQQTYARAFIRYLATYQAGFTPQLLSGITYAQFAILFAATCALISYRYRDRSDRMRFIVMVGIIAVGAIGYGFAIYLTFLFGGMIDSERDNLLTGDRYLRTYVFACLLILFALFVMRIIRLFNARRSRTVGLMTLGITVAVTIGFLFNIDLIKNHRLVENSTFMAEYAAQGIPDPMAQYEQVRRFATSTGATYGQPKTVATTELSGRQTAYLMRYLMLPNKVPNGNDLMLDADPSQDTVCAVLKRSDFLFIEYAFTDDRSLELINGCLVDDIGHLSRYDAYKIEKGSNGIRLIHWNY